MISFIAPSNVFDFRSLTSSPKDKNVISITVEANAEKNVFFTLRKLYYTKVRKNFDGFMLSVVHSVRKE